MQFSSAIIAKQFFDVMATSRDPGHGNSQLSEGDLRDEPEQLLGPPNPEWCQFLDKVVPLDTPYAFFSFCNDEQTSVCVVKKIELTMIVFTYTRQGLYCF